MTKDNFLYVATDVNNGLSTFDQKLVNAELSAIVAFISVKCFKSIRIPDTPGIRIDLTDNIQNERIDKPIIGVYPVCRCVQYFNFIEFFSADNTQKKIQIINLIKKGVTSVSHEMGWETDSIWDALNLLDSLNLNFSFEFNKPKAYKGGQAEIYVECSIEPGYNNYDLIIQIKGKIAKRHRVVSLNHYYGIADFYTGPSRIISEGKWQDENTYLIVGKKGHLERIVFKYDLTKDTIEISFNLEPDVNKETFMEEFRLSTTNDPNEIKKVLEETSFKWHEYL